jgi:predicted nucleotidyltransferase
MGPMIEQTKIPLPQILREVQNHLKRVYGSRLKQLVLYGSWARREPHLESDIDILVVLDFISSRYEEIKKINEAIHSIALEYNLVISAIPMSSEYLKRYRTTAFIHNVFNEGIPLYEAGA